MVRFCGPSSAEEQQKFCCPEQVEFCSYPLCLQNVLIQMGLRVLSVSGMVIRQARNYILRCHACFR